MRHRVKRENWLLIKEEDAAAQTDKTHGSEGFHRKPLGLEQPIGLERGGHRATGTADPRHRRCEIHAMTGCASAATHVRYGICNSRASGMG
jgi:hypothetical protein